MIFLFFKTQKLKSPNWNDYYRTILGKRPLVRRRGRGGKQFRAITVGKILPARYPNFKLEEQHEGKILDIIHERGRDAPLAKVEFDNHNISYIPAPEGTSVGGTIKTGVGTPANPKNILSLESIPDGTLICNIEKNAGDGGKLIKAAGSSAIVFSHSSEGVTVNYLQENFYLLIKNAVPW